MRSTLDNLPKDKRGFPIPWFVTQKKENGEPDFVKIHPLRAYEAATKKRCWICGGNLEKLRTFVCGPISLATRHVTEPPMHLDCARFAVKTCPFMLHPNYRRQWTEDLDSNVPGIALERNPGVSVLATTNRCKTTVTLEGPLFYIMGDMKLEAYREGRAATREEYLTSLAEGLVLLQQRSDVAAMSEEQQAEMLKVFADARNLTFANEPPAALG